MDPNLVWYGVAAAVAVALLLLIRGGSKGGAPAIDEADEPTHTPGPATGALKTAVLGDEDEDEAPAEAEEAPAEAKPKARGWGLGKTRKEGFIARLGALFADKETVDSALLDQLEETLFKADIGVRTVQRLLEGCRAASAEGGSADELWEFLRTQALEILQVEYAPRPVEGDGPRVVLVIGVNGSGKTTTIGKLAGQARKRGEEVTLAAGDTYRAAAGDQLGVWADRVGAHIVGGAEGADPSSVIFEGIEKGAEAGHDLVICDTARRLHTKKPLMDELEKVHRVCGKARAGAPHEVLLVVDATNGQNAILQARDFNKAIAVDAIVLTKLDGTAKGGVILGVSDELGIPVRYIGVGEALEDLREFDPRGFVDELFARPQQGAAA